MNEDNKIKIFNLIILDKSGSMRVIRNAAVDGFNDVLEGIRVAQAESELQEHYVSLLTFCDCKKEYVYDCVPVNEVRNLTLRDYNPCCNTPLFDAMGMALSNLVSKVENEKHSTAAVTIITDGEENSSREYNGESIKAFVDKLQKELDWKFSYIGTNQDVEAIADSLAIRDSFMFQCSNDGMRNAWNEERNRKKIMYSSIDEDIRCCISVPLTNEEVTERKGKIKEMLEELRDNSGTTTTDWENHQASDRHNRIRQMLEKLRGNNDRTTPHNISFLENNQIFVFGSNEHGRHGGGAAHTAVIKFGAIMGQGEGLQGQSYAIPTMEGIDNMRKAIDRFIEYAKEHPELTFLVTRIGCGIAGYREEEVAPLFADAKDISNIYLPSGFWNKINQ